MKKLTALAMTLAVAGVALAGGIAGQVVSARTGNPIENAKVVAFGVNGVMGRAATDAAGLYVIENLAEGRYKVTAAAEAYEPEAYPAPVGVREGEITRGVDFRLKPKQQTEPGVITGRVVDRETGEPISGAAVAARGEAGKRRARTDEQGRYVLRGLKPGVYKVAANARGYVEKIYPQPVPVRQGQTVEGIDFALAPKPRPGAISGQVIDAKTREPIAVAAVMARGERGAGKAETDGHGFYRIVRLAPGLYKVTAMKQGYSQETYPRPVPVRPSDITKNIDFILHPVRAEAE